ncbi:hypothetical protein ACVBEF_05810 [Glaciimonas sp. GG7]
MSVSTTTGAAVAGAAASAFTLTGSFIGMQHNYLVAGFFGGIIALRFIAESSRLRMAVSVFTSAVLGAYGAPILAAVLAEHFPYLAHVREGALPLLCACSIGVCAQTIVPVCLHWVRKFSGVSS